MRVQIAKDRYEVDVSHPLDISIPVTFHGNHISVFHAPAASSRPYGNAGFVGSVADGGSCNCDVQTLISHTSGTHTECIGHIADSLISIYDTLRDGLLPATVITVQPEIGAGSGDSYPLSLDPSDFLLTRNSLECALNQPKTSFLDAVIVRTLPNPDEKRTHDYDKIGSPFFSTEAMQFLVDLGNRHLLVDLPSVDRLHDEGRLTNHRIFWDVPMGSHHIDKTSASLKTITELVYVPDGIPDGQYLLNLQVAPFVSDAAPSRPILYKVRAI